MLKALAFGNERQLPGKIHLSAGAEDNRRLRDGLTDGSIDPVTSSLGGSGIMERGGTGGRQESATNLGGLKYPIPLPSLFSQIQILLSHPSKFYIARA